MRTERRRLIRIRAARARIRWVGLNVRFGKHADPREFTRLTRAVSGRDDDGRAKQGAAAPECRLTVDLHQNEYDSRMPVPVQLAVRNRLRRRHQEERRSHYRNQCNCLSQALVLPPLSRHPHVADAR